jgi:uroporphyrinogen-III synthase
MKTNIDLNKMKIAAIGTKTADNLKNFGFVPDFLPTVFSSQQFVKEFPALAPYPVEKGVLYFTSKLADNFLETKIRTKNIKFKRVNLYTTICAINKELPKFKGIVFASPSCVNCFKEKFSLNDIKGKIVVAIGTKTKNYLETLNIKSFTPKQFTLQDAVDLCSKLL